MISETMNWGDEPQVLESFPRSVKRLIWLLQSQQVLTAGSVRTSLRVANVKLDELLPAVELSHSAWKSYGESCLYDSGACEVIVRSWAPGDFSAIHANTDLDWEVVQCFGGANFYTYALQDDVLYASGRKQLRSGTILPIGGGTISQIGNFGQLPALSLHVRYRGQAAKADKEPTRIFNLLAGEVQKNSSGAHFNILPTQAARPVRASIRLSGDWKTSLRYYRHLRDRLQQVLHAANSNIQIVRERLRVVEEHIARLQSLGVA